MRDWTVTGVQTCALPISFWESTYSTVESLGAGTAYSPSPPATVNHSAPVSAPPGPPPPPPPPPPPRPLDIPHPALLSCKPPPRTYGTFLSAATTQNCSIRRWF